MKSRVCITEGSIIRNNGKKMLWDWEHEMRTHCKARRPDLTLQDERRKEINIMDMACPTEGNKIVKRNTKKIPKKCQQLCLEL